MNLSFVGLIYCCLLLQMELIKFGAFLLLVKSLNQIPADCRRNAFLGYAMVDRPLVRVQSEVQFFVTKNMFIMQECSY